MDIEKLKYPIGPLLDEINSTPEIIKQWITDIEELPKKVNAVVNGLSNEQLSWRYRPDGWTIRQVVHHLADSHMNALIRVKLALTEVKPTIKPYMEAEWAKLPYMNMDIQVSLDILEPLHKQFTYLLNTLNEDDLIREYVHPEYNKTYNITYAIYNYSWHCRHHYAHILQALKHKGKFD